MTTTKTPQCPTGDHCPDCFNAGYDAAKISSANVSTADLLEILEESMWDVTDLQYQLQSRLDNIRDLVRVRLHDAGVKVDPDIAANDEGKA